MNRGARILLLLAVGAVCVFAFARWVVRPYRCNQAVTKYYPISMEAERLGPVRAAIRARENLQVLQPMCELCRTEINLYMLVALNQQTLHRDDDALRTYEDALKIDQRPEIYTAMGDIYVAHGEMEKAVELYAQVVRFGPQLLDTISNPLAADLVRAKLHEARTSDERPVRRRLR